MHEWPGACPVCGGELAAVELRCNRCESWLRGRFAPCEFCTLNADQRTFLRLFLAARGNLTEVEKRLGVSYPTVRAKLDEVLDRLDLREPAAPVAPVAAVPAPAVSAVPVAAVAAVPANATAVPTSRRALLEAVARGELDPERARRQLRLKEER